MAKDKALEGEIVNQPASVRFTKHPEDKVQLLEAAFNNDFNVTEACQYAGISRTAYYEWLEDDDIFVERMEAAQTALKRTAKANVQKAIREGDPNISLRYLTLRDPAFKPKAEVDNKGSFDEERKKLKEFLDDDDSPDVVGAQSAAADSETARGEVAEAPTDIS